MQYIYKISSVVSVNKWFTILLNKWFTILLSKSASAYTSHFLEILPSSTAPDIDPPVTIMKSKKCV